METYEKIKLILENEINYVKSTETHEALLEINHSYKQEFENIKKDLENYSENQKNNENKLNEIIKLIMDLNQVIMKKRKQFNNENVMPNNQISENNGNLKINIIFIILFS